MDGSQKRLILSLKTKFLNQYQFKPSQLLPSLPFLRQYGDELLVKEKQPVPVAIERFLELIIDCKEPAVFVTFIRALKDNGFARAASLLEGPFHCDDAALQELLNAFYPTLVDKVIPSDILPHFCQHQFMSKTDEQEISFIEDNSGPRQAMIEFLSIAGTKSKYWLAKLVYSLRKAGYDYIVNHMLDNSKAESLNRLIEEEKLLVEHHKKSSDRGENFISCGEIDDTATMMLDTTHYHQSAEKSSNLAVCSSKELQLHADTSLEATPSKRPRYWAGYQEQGSTSSSQGLDYNAQDLRRNINTVHNSTSDRTEEGTSNVSQGQLAASKPVVQVGPQVRQLEPEIELEMESAETQLKTVSDASHVTVSQLEQHDTEVEMLAQSTPSVAATSSTGMLVTPNSLQAAEHVRYSPEGEEHSMRSVMETQNSLGSRESLDTNSYPASAAVGNTSSTANENTSPSPASEENIVREELVLRNYQLELAEKAKEGKNCIIVAPTGSGKTIVAIDIIRDHFEKASIPGEAKVIFFAPTTVLVEQQCKQVKKYLPHLTSVVIKGSNNGPKLALSLLCQTYDVLVMTPQILVDAIKMNNVSLSQFTLLLFDECHHVNKDEPYNVIMGLYMDEKLSDDVTNLPQVVGMTASVGTGQARDETEAVKHIVSLCAKLDSKFICRIRIHTAELHRHVKSPSENIVEVMRRQRDPFKEVIERLMARIETVLKEKWVEAELPDLAAKLVAPVNRGTDQYTIWVGQLFRLVHEIYDQRLRQLYASCHEFLDIYNNSLLLNEDCRSQDALAYILKEFSKKDGLKRSPIETDLYQQFQNSLNTLDNISKDPTNINPKLRTLKEQILSAHQKNPDLRCILFCKTREMTVALSTWINEELGVVKSRYLTGTNSGSDYAGLTQNQQEDVVRHFRDGLYKVVVCTSVVEEGLDISKCNLVIRYEFVTHENAMIQARGRGRADESEYILVTMQDSKEAEKERINRLRERLMYRALNQISGWKENKLVTAINRQQQEDKMERARKREDEEQKKKLRRLKQTNNDTFTLRCFKCDSFCCFSNEVLCRDTHYFVGSDSLRDRVDIHLHPKPQRISGFDGELYKKMKMFCKKCSYEWGIVALYRDIKLPIIKIESFFIYNKDGVKSYVKKWKDVPFASRTLTVDDICEFTARPILDDI